LIWAENWRKKKNCGSQVAEIEKKNGEKLIVAMELLKMGGKKKKNCGNGVVPKLEERERIFRLKKNILQYRFLF